jgi:hypothetical protein
MGGNIEHHARAHFLAAFHCGGRHMGQQNNALERTKAWVWLSATLVDIKARTRNLTRPKHPCEGVLINYITA